MNEKVSAYIGKVKNWQAEIKALRAMLIEFPLTEELKWGKPCYAFENSNIIIIQGFKEYCGLLFFKGALLKDAKGLLVKPGENTQGGRLLKFTSVQEINKLTTTIKSYIKEAIEIEKKGLKIEPINTELVLPEELLAQFKKSASFKKAFNALTPGRQRAYNMFFTAAKQAATRKTRIEKYKDQIMSGKGINDCTCGLSQKMPYCDGSHKQLK
jgi:uncharacterized protein YdeI (YjbR/CyaY-like superfamily)